MKVTKSCEHDWCTLSMDHHDVSGCLGVICTKCGELSCACNKKFSTDYNIGNEAYKKFHLNKENNNEP